MSQFTSGEARLLTFLKKLIPKVKKLIPKKRVVFSFLKDGSGNYITDFNGLSIIVATADEVEVLEDDIRKWLFACNTVIGFAAFSLGLGAAGTDKSMMWVHAGLSCGFVTGLHLYSYHVMTRSFFKFTCTSPQIVANADRKIISIAFRRYIRKTRFSYFGIFPKTWIWFLGVAYLAFVFIYGVHLVLSIVA